MDRAAKELFTTGCLTLLLFAVGLGLGCWLLLIEFGAAFNETSGDREMRTITSIALFIVNPFGMIGWILGVKKLVPPALGIAIFVLGSALSSLIYGKIADSFFERRRKKSIEEQAGGFDSKESRS